MMVVRAGPSIPMVHGTLSIDSSDLKLWEPRNYLKLESQRHSKLSLTSWVRHPTSINFHINFCLYHRCLRYFTCAVIFFLESSIPVCHANHLMSSPNLHPRIGWEKWHRLSSTHSLLWKPSNKLSSSAPWRHLFSAPCGSHFHLLLLRLSVTFCVQSSLYGMFHTLFLWVFCWISDSPCFLVTKPLPPTVGLDPPRWHPFSQPWWREWYHSAVEHRGVSQGSVEPHPAVSTTLIGDRMSCLVVYIYVYIYPLVICNIANWKMAIEIVENGDFPYGGWALPLWKMMEFVNGKDDIPYMNWKIKNVWNHQMRIWWMWCEVTHNITIWACLKMGYPTLLPLKQGRW